MGERHYCLFFRHRMDLLVWVDEVILDVEDEVVDHHVQAIYVWEQDRWK